jgi:hypothetical protein
MVKMTMTRSMGATAMIFWVAIWEMVINIEKVVMEH